MSENTREITLEEAKKLYNSSEEAKAFLLSKFTKDELEGNILPTQEEFDKFFEENILPLIDYSKTRFLDCDNGKVSKTPTSRIELRNSDDKWLFDYNYDQENQHFWYSNARVYTIFMKQFSLQNVDRHRLIKSLVEKHFNLHVCQPWNLSAFHLI
jgi:hypothetical protein